MPVVRAHDKAARGGGNTMYIFAMAQDLTLGDHSNINSKGVTPFVYGSGASGLRALLRSKKKRWQKRDQGVTRRSAAAMA